MRPVLCFPLEVIHLRDDEVELTKVSVHHPNPVSKGLSINIGQQLAVLHQIKHTEGIQVQFLVWLRRFPADSV